MAEKLQLENMTITDEDATVPLRDVNNKRSTYLDWDDYFMATAFLAAMRSKDPVTQVGACIVNEKKRIVAVGYNGMPTGCHDDNFPWGKESEDKSDTKYLYVCHAELNAILNKNASDVKNCSLYVGLFPCNECAKAVIQAGIKRVFYISDKHSHKETTIAAKRLLDAAKVEYSQYLPKNKKIVIDFSEINWNSMMQLPELPPTPPRNEKLDATSESSTFPSSVDPLMYSEICHGEQESSYHVNHKLSIHLDWEEYFMAMAFLAAMRSKDPVTQVGACIVNKDKKIVAIGYNGMPTGCHDDDFPWGKQSEDKTDTKHLYVCHAELNAILNKNASDVENCSIYVGLFPCNECAKAIIQSGIKTVFYMSDKHSHKVTTIASKRMFDAAGVEYYQYEPKNKKIVLNLSEINRNYMAELPPTPPKNEKPDITNKRSSYLDWDEYFMATAFLAAMRSKDPDTKVGACIVNEKKRIVAVGYNGMPNGCHDDDFPWEGEAKAQFDTKYPYVCHAELNAILNKNASNVENCLLYVGLFPCNKCAQAIIQSGIKKVFYMSDKQSDKETIIAAKRMFDATNIEYRQYEPKNIQIVIDFCEINWNSMTQLPPTPAKNREL